MGQKRTVCFALSVIAAILMVITGAVIHLMGWWEEGVQWDIFDKKESDVWDRYENKDDGDVMFYYSQWIFCMWVIVYVSQLSWTLYGLELICRKSRAGHQYHYVPIVPTSAFILTVVAMAAILVWLFLWTSGNYRYFRYGPLCLLGSTVCFYVALAVSVATLSKYLPILHGKFNNNNRYVWEIRILVQNSLGLAASWTTVVLFYCLILVMDENDILPAASGANGYIFLSFLAGYLIIWFVVDMSVARQYCPFLLTPYVVFILAEVQALLRTELIFSYYFIYSAILLGVTCVLLLLKFALAIGTAKYV